jgi:NTE family protein
LSPMTEDRAPVRRALVLGGGGITGIAWELGIPAGLAELGIDLSDADLVIGTSAGSVVGAKLTSGTDLESLYAEQLQPPTSEQRARLGPRQLVSYAWAALRARDDQVGFGVRMGRLAIRTADQGRTPSVTERLAIIESRLPSTAWPDRPLVLTAVDALTGAFRTFDATSGVPLLEAVAASCAVPGVYPPVTIDGRRYIDGGMRSGANADLAAGCDRVVALTPIARGLGPMTGTQQQLDELGVPAVMITPDQAAVRAIGRNVLDPAARAASARAGREQAADARERVAAVWAA